MSESNRRAAPDRAALRHLAPETDRSWLIPEIPLFDLVADIRFKALVRCVIGRFLRFEFHCMRNATEIVQGDFARARAHRTFERVVRYECIDERAIERFRRTTQGFELDRPALFRRFEGR